jgi:hypothetical protein
VSSIVHNSELFITTVSARRPPSSYIVDEATYSSQWTFKGDCKNNTKDKGRAVDGHEIDNDNNDNNNNNEHKEVKIDESIYVIPEALLWMNPFQRLMLYLARQEKVDNNTWQCLISISLVCLCLSCPFE